MKKWVTSTEGRGFSPDSSDTGPAAGEKDGEGGKRQGAGGDGTVEHRTTVARKMQQSRVLGSHWPRPWSANAAALMPGKQGATGLDSRSQLSHATKDRHQTALSAQTQSALSMKRGRRPAPVTHSCRCRPVLGSQSRPAASPRARGCHSHRTPASRVGGGSTSWAPKAFKHHTQV